MNNFWIDANLILRFLTGEPQDLAERALRFIQALQALERMADSNVDFVDAYLAEIARHAGGTIASFDRDFRRLDIPWLEPE